MNFIIKVLFPPIFYRIHKGFPGYGLKFAIITACQLLGGRYCPKTIKRAITGVEALSCPLAPYWDIIHPLMPLEHFAVGGIGL